MKSSMSSRERILACLALKPTDHIPLSFDGIYHGLVTFINQKYPDKFKKAQYYQALGADTAVSITPPLVSNAEFSTRQWAEQVPGEAYPILNKEYTTPAGILRQRVRKTEDYPSSVSLFSDHNVPGSRSLRYLVEKEEDLEKLVHILKAPAGKELDDFRQEAAAARKFCDQHQILLSGYLSGVGDPLMWLSGVEKVLITALENPGFLARYVKVIADWDRRRLESMIEAGVDLVVRRGWYESTDFWSPDLYKQFLFEPLKNEIEIAHAAGVKYTYVMNSGTMPLLGHFKELGFDLYSNIDPLTPHTDLGRIKREVGGRIALCGGVNNTHVLEEGTVEDVGKAVAQAVETLGPGGGFILAPGDSLMLKTDEITQRNFYAMVEAWKKVA